MGRLVVIYSFLLWPGKRVFFIIDDGVRMSVAASIFEVLSVLFFEFFWYYFATSIFLIFK